MITLEKIDEVFHELMAVEAILSKAVKVSPVTQTRRIEEKLRQYLLAKWNTLRKEATEKAIRLFLSGQSSATIERAVRKIMTEWSDEVKKQLLDDVARIYRLGRESLWQKAQRLGAKPVKKAEKKDFVIRPSFDLKDKKAIRSIQDQQLFWISEVDDYQEEIASKVRDVVESVILEGGESRVFAGQELREEIDRLLGYISTPSGFKGSAESYFEGLAAAASTTARTQGQIRSLEELEVTSYRVVNPLDSKTCPICSELNGKVFTVEMGGRIVENELAASTPEEVKDAHPFVTFSEVEGLSAEELAEKGIILPPFHFQCRCHLDIDSDSIFRGMEEEEDIEEF